MGAVYRATDTKLNRDVAIKVLPDSLAVDPDRLARFTREAQVLASLNHPNIAAIYGVEERAIVLELVEGASPGGPLPEEDALPLIAQLIDALEYAHEKGIIHRDLKPANLRVTPEGRLKVLDFGLAKALATESAPADPASSPTITMRATMAGVIMGTAGYMSPEQARGHAVDKRADIWAFGAVVYELLTGRMLFHGETVTDTLAAVLRQDPDWSAVPAKFQRLLRLCLIRDPRQRLRDISGARLLLEESASAPSATPARPTRWIGATAAALLAALVIAASAMAWGWRASRTLVQPLMRLSVDLGSEAVAEGRAVFALSPDGRRIVYTARRTRDSQTLLATRLLDQAKIDFLNGSEGATDPFFSPDGQWIAFFAEGKLKKITVTGGAPVVLAADVPNPRGGTWGPESIVFAPVPNTGLVKVPAAGGPLQKLTDPTSKGYVTHRWPQWLPGGHALIFTAHHTTGGLNDAEIDALDAKSGQFKTVQRGGFFGRYLQSGHLVYVHDGSLFAVRFDPDRLETQGTPVPMLTDVAANVITAAGRFDFSTAAGAGIFAYMRGSADIVPSRVAWIEKSGTTISEFSFHPPQGWVGGGSVLSPDGRQVAFSEGAIGNGNIKVWDMQREVLISITTNSHNNSYPVWSPDGRHLVYTSGVNAPFPLWWARSDGGGEPRKIAEANGRFMSSSFLPDGSRLAYVDSMDAKLRLLPLDLRDPANPKAGTPEITATPDSTAMPMMSPDGRWIAVISDSAGTSGKLFVCALPPAEGRWPVAPNLDVGAVRWSRSARQLFFATTDGRLMVMDYEVKGDAFLAGKARLWTEIRLSSNLGRASFDIAPDGRILTTVNPAESAGQRESVHVTFLVNFMDELKRRVP